MDVVRNTDGGGQHGPPPLILIHGAGGNHLYWPPELRRWPEAPVFALDLPGHGRSQGSSQSTLSGYAEHVLDWLRAEAMAPAVLMGHSMGGAIALTMALRAPQRVAGLVLVGSGARLRVAPAILELSAAASTFPHAVEKVMQAAFSSHTPDRLIQLARERMLAAGHTAFHNDFLACDHFDVRSRLAELTMPALVVSGRDDRLMPPKFGLELAEGLPVGEFAEIPHAGHMVMLEQAKALAKLVADFYQAHFHRN